MSDAETPTKEAYRVLALKYRPQNFEELIGQDALVRTLKNAIESGRVAHAFMLTGVRGVGKTTTARIIAKALNYTGADGTADATTGDTADCQLCQAISEDRHPDVIEMDAASRTGVDDIREILDGVRYAPTEARYKIYIIDEVHMLSKQAFNALLKTLEEPPPHVKFIFATTEINKVPVTVLSRCQRFDLRRVDEPTLMAHFEKICASEKVTAEEEALSLITRAADGSVRDGLSLLDQAIGLGGETVSAEQVQNMLGLADRARNIDLLDQLLAGQMPEALALMDDLYKSGADPIILMQDLLAILHGLTKMRAVPNAPESSMGMTGDAAARLQEMAAKLSMPSLSKAWQILLKGLGEVGLAPNPQAAAEMVLIRLSYAANLPDPADLLKTLKDGGGDSAPSAPNGGGSSAGTPQGQTVQASGGAAPPSAQQSQSAPTAQLRTVRGGGGSQMAAVASAAPVQDEASDDEEQLWGAPIENLRDVVAALTSADEMLLASQISHSAHLVKIEKGRLEIRPDEMAHPKLAANTSAALSKITGERWMVSVSSSAGAATLSEQDKAQWLDDVAQMKTHPEIAEILSVFPEAEIKAIKHMDKD